MLGNLLRAFGLTRIVGNNGNETADVPEVQLEGGRDHHAAGHGNGLVSDNVNGASDDTWNSILNPTWPTPYQQTLVDERWGNQVIPSQHDVHGNIFSGHAPHMTDTVPPMFSFSQSEQPQSKHHHRH